jgi:hypothetical protein
VLLAAGQAYAVSFLVGEWLNGGTASAQTLEVRLDDAIVIGRFKSGDTGGGSDVLFTGDAFKVNNSGRHTVTIVGTNLMGGDNTALIDEVTVTGPEPEGNGLTATGPVPVADPNVSATCTVPELTTVPPRYAFDVASTTGPAAAPAASVRAARDLNGLS